MMTTKKEISGGVVHDLPPDMQKALASDPKSLAAWENITPLARNEWICWVTIVKKADTRKEHITRMRLSLRKMCADPVVGRDALIEDQRHKNGFQKERLNRGGPKCGDKRGCHVPAVGWRGRWGRRCLLRRGSDCIRKTQGAPVDLFGAQAVHFQGMRGRDRLKVLAPVPRRCH